jgi:D-alanyl-D-alanine dipeptidase
VQRKDFRQIIKRNMMVISVACTIFGCSQPEQEQQPASQLARKPHTGKQYQQKQTEESNNEKRSEITSLETRLKKSGLVNLSALDKTIIVDLKYSTEDNFVGVDVYGSLADCYLQPEVADMLVTAQKELQHIKPGYHLLLFDCARPLSVQRILWDTLQKPEELKHLYVADPNEGSIHNYGSAVDLTIADAYGMPLDMGTEYDHFSELAYPSKEEEQLANGALTKEQVENRHLLREVMAHAGFSPIDTEWWHFNAYSRNRAAELFEMIE